ncbi:MAG: TIGR00730 family Rossman fold protein, partial [Actinomycetia bacterium]|nr:TIGR00730 family Rossman fold protein [Actinomycetes bacterium]
PGSPGYWSLLEAFLDAMVDAGYAKPENRGIVKRVETVAEVLSLLD